MIISNVPNQKMCIETTKRFHNHIKRRVLHMKGKHEGGMFSFSYVLLTKSIILGWTEHKIGNEKENSEERTKFIHIPSITSHILSQS